MNTEELHKLINNLVSLTSETETVEFKKNNFNKDEIGKRLSALANAGNLHEVKKSYLVFGVEDGTHRITGTHFNPAKEKVGNDHLEFWLNQRMNPKIDFRIHLTVRKVAQVLTGL